MTKRPPAPGSIDNRPENRWRWFHGVAIGLSLLVTLAAWSSASRLVEERREARFNREADRVISQFDERLAHYEDALQAGIAALDSHGGRIDRERWRRFAAGLELGRRYKGVKGVGLIERVSAAGVGSLVARERVSMPDFDLHPTLPRSDAAAVRLPILFIEPAASNRRAIGLDVTFEKRRREAAFEALATGEPRITGPIRLVQEASERWGFLFYAPYDAAERNLKFDRGLRTEVPNDDRAEFVGLVYAPFVVSDLVTGMLSPENRNVDITIFDGGEPIHSEGDDETSIDAAYGRSITVKLHGREWRFDIRSNARFESANSSRQPLLILLGGVLIDVMLVALFLSMSKGYCALRRTAGMTAELEARTRELEASNADLERFALIVSHDLKTPVRGISDLAWYLEEDLEPWLSTPDANPEIRDHLARITVQTRRIDSLIDGILDYSGIGQREAPPEAVDIRELVEEIGIELDLAAGHLMIEGDLPVVCTSRIRLQQVLANLIGNAFKYNPDRVNAITRVRIDLDDDRCLVSVSDNGPGIDPQFHERIFEIFQTLQRKDAIESSGIGLAIVKRVIEHVGGSIRVESAPGAGTTFHVVWPIAAVDLSRLETKRAA